MDELHASGTFDVLNYANELADRGSAKFLGVAQTKINAGLIHELFIQRKRHIRPLRC